MKVKITTEIFYCLVPTILVSWSFKRFAFCFLNKHLVFIFNPPADLEDGKK
jgi:hypothetical protein